MSRAGFGPCSLQVYHLFLLFLSFGQVRKSQNVSYGSEKLKMFYLFTSF